MITTSSTGPKALEPASAWELNVSWAAVSAFLTLLFTVV